MSLWMPTVKFQQFMIAYVNDIVRRRGEWDEIADVGNIIYDTETGIYVSIERIAGIRFEGETMYVTYEFSPVPEWSDYEMDEAVLKYRHRFMHLVRHDEKRTQEQKPS